MKILIAIFSIICSSVYSQSASLSRDILCLYDSSETSLPNQPIYKSLGVVYEQLGLKPTFHDIEDPLPSHSEMSKYRGILAWFLDEKLSSSENYLEWLQKEAELGRKLIFWNTLGVSITDNSMKLHEFFKSFQMKLILPGVSALPVSSIEADKDYFSFERALETTQLNYIMVAAPEEGRNLLKTNTPLGWAVKAHIGEKVSFAFNDCVIKNRPNSHLSQWVINPYKFLKEALELPLFPAFDITTLNGHRIYFSQLDGDGSLNLNDNDPERINVKYFLDEYLKKYKLPFTISCVEGEIKTATNYKWIKDREIVVDAFKNIFKLPNVEAAAHGFSHPMDWREGITAIAIPPYSRKPETKSEMEIIDSSIYSDFNILTLPTEKWEEREIMGSVRYIEKYLCPPGKKVKLFLWTGNCNPSENALRICRENNILNLNGGEYRFDKQNPSISMVPPLLRPVGKEKQVLIGAANEMIYTNNWSRNFEGFSNVLETIKKTGYPRRLKPANLYLHFFTVEKKPSAAAVHGIIKEFLQMDLAPLFTGEYAAMAQDYSNAELRSDDKFWYWENCGSVPSLRLEGKVYPDMLSSKGILGYYFDSKLNCTYIHLDGSGKGRTRLSSKPAESIYLKRSNTTVSNWVLEKNSLSFTAKARGRLDFQISGLESDKEYTLEVDGQAIVLNTDSSGLLEGKKLSEKFGLIKLRLNLVGK